MLNSTLSTAITREGTIMTYIMTSSVMTEAKGTEPPVGAGAAESSAPYSSVPNCIKGSSGNHIVTSSFKAIV